MVVVDQHIGFDIAFIGDDIDCLSIVRNVRYFLGDFQETIKRLVEKLNRSGKMVITIFQDNKEGAEENVLPDSTHLAQVLKEEKLAYEWYDFTKNVRAHGIRNYQVGEELREAFEREGNGFLYEARVAENRFFKEVAEREAIVRYMYVAQKNHSA